MKVSHFITTRFTDDDYQIVVNYGPIVVVFEVTDTGLQYVAEGSNVNLSWDHMPQAALEAARYNRKFNAKIMNEVEARRKHGAVVRSMQEVN